MYRYNCLRILIFSLLFSTVYSDVQFNSLSQKLVLSLINTTQIKNVVASEQLVRYPLCKLASVATGDAKRELMLVLGYRDDEALSKCYKKVKGYISVMIQSDLTVTNRIYVSDSSSIDPNFVQKSSEIYGVRVERVGFNYPKAAVAHINKLIDVMMFKRITDIVDTNDINKSTKMIIISGAHFKGTWEDKFDFRMTKLAQFKHIDGKISRIPMMNKMGEFWYNQDGLCEVLVIRFRSSEASIAIALPKSGYELLSVLQQIYNDKGYLKGLTKGAQEKIMKVTLPRFKIKTFLDWTGFLQGLGLYSIFNRNSSDLVGILKKGVNQTMFLSKVKQKVFIQIDEMGVSRGVRDHLPTTKAPTIPYYNLPAFIADRPFYFEIAWEIDGGRYELFSGVYYGPEPDLDAF